MSLMLLSCLGSGAPAQSDDQSALLGLLIRKGVLTQQEADQFRAEVRATAQAAEDRVMPNAKSTRRLSIGMRMQAQYAHLDTDVRDSGVEPAVINHAALRRMYLTLKAKVGEHWGAAMTYDLASSGYDEAVIEWRPTTRLSFDFGLRKVNVAHEERATSGDIRAIERSSVTRYFVESNNGRRLGAAGYRVGAFLDGSRELHEALSFNYGAAITNPERDETFSGSAGFGGASNNRPALWGNAGVSGKFRGGTWTAGAGTGFLPDQGGADPALLGCGHDLTLFSFHVDVSAARWGLMAEYLVAEVERGAGPNSDARPAGFFVQPTLRLTRTTEAVIRYAFLDSDGRGVTLSDVVRSAASGGTMDKFSEWYAGANWYLQGNDLKLQLGAVYGKTYDTPAAADAASRVLGVRSQMQVQF